jgi:hypothetical protein
LLGWLRKRWEEWGYPPPKTGWKGGPQLGFVLGFGRIEQRLLRQRDLMWELIRKVLVFLGPDRFPIVARAPKGGGNRGLTTTMDYVLLIAEAKDVIGSIDRMLSADKPPTPAEVADLEEEAVGLSESAVVLGL